MAVIADFLTFSRILIAALIVLFGYFYSGRGLRYVILLLLAGWSTDMLDGNFARKSSIPTSLGKFDFIFDFIMVLSSFFYLMIAGIVDPFFFYAYTALLLAVAIFSRSQSAVMLFLCPLTFLPFIVAASVDRTAFSISVLWAVFAFILDRHRFFGVIAEFAENFPGGYLKTTAEFFERLASQKNREG